MASGARWFPTKELRKLLSQPALAALTRTHFNADIKPVDQSVVVKSNPAGVFDAFDNDLIPLFQLNNETIATATINGVLDTGTGYFTLSLSASTGEETTVAYYGPNGGADSVRAEVTHTASGKVATASFSSSDQTVAGSTPGVISEGGGGGGGGGSK